VAVFGIAEAQLVGASEAEDVAARCHHRLINALSAALDGIAVEYGIHGDDGKRIDDE
jgi:hypothetical protein